jgi:hypothetical protein
MILFGACKSKTDDVDLPEVTFEWIRFDKLYANANNESLKELRLKFPYLFPGNEKDAFWMDYKNDSLYYALDVAIDKVFSNDESLKSEVKRVFQRVKSYYPSFEAPKVITLNSKQDFDNQVFYADSLLFVSLDTYLGVRSPFYQGFPEYIVNHFTPENIPLDVATAIASTTFSTQPNPVFLERMVDAGKLKYALQQFSGIEEDAKIMSYDESQVAWVQDNSFHIWQYFVEKEYLYSSDRELIRRFLDPAPFSKFYIESDMESPGQVGVWVGWQIVQRYAQQFPSKTLPEILATPSMEIYNDSHYKPQK